MKSKTRKIIVNNEEYRWSVSGIDWDMDWPCVKIWKNKKEICHKEVREKAITPKIIEQLIMAL